MVRLNIIGDETPTYTPKPLHLDTQYVDWFSPPNKNSFIETGTYKGETSLLMMRHGFKFIRSVDLTGEFVSKEVTEEFEEALQKYNCNAQLVLGDSPDAIPIFINEIKKFWKEPWNQEAVFWLDAHASGEIPGGRSGGSPLLDELLAIEKDNIKTHTIFIDDRRLFGSAEWSYVTEEQCMEILRRINPNYQFFYLDGQIPQDVLVATVYDNRKTT